MHGVHKNLSFYLFYRRSKVYSSHNHHLQLHSSLSNKSTFAYEFRHNVRGNGQFSLYPIWLKTGATHTEEAKFVFGFQETRALVYAIKLISTFQKSWFNCNLNKSIWSWKK